MAFGLITKVVVDYYFRSRHDSGWMLVDPPVMPRR
jgi:hypothetical protein